MILRALKAKQGDSLLLLGDDAKVLIDGGPSGVWEQNLRHQLRGLGGDGGDPPQIDLLIVSHIDADHIDGVLDLTSELIEAQQEERDPIVRIDGAWHNSFSDAIAAAGTQTSGQVRASAASLASTFGDLIGPGLSPHESKLVLASVTQGRDLRLDLEALNIDLNRYFKDRLVLNGNQRRRTTFGNLELTVIGPTQSELDDLREKWARELPKILAKGAAAPSAARALDSSISNLASIVVVAKVGDKSALLTGDARGDMILLWLKQTGVLESGKSIHFHIVKLPHHGSDRNVTPAFFERITADHYVVSGDGKHGNPEPATFEMLFEARPELDYTIHMTYKPNELNANREFQENGNVPKLEDLLSDPNRRNVFNYPEGGQKYIDIPF